MSFIVIFLPSFFICFDTILGWVFARSRNHCEVWPMILEKAYAKMYHTYEAIEAGQVHRALVDFTNGIGSSMDMTKNAEKQMIRNGTLWTQLLKYVYSS
jgi:hypothetical protein